MTVPPPAPPPPPRPPSGADHLAQLRRLREEGVLSEAEYTAAVRAAVTGAGPAGPAGGSRRMLPAAAAAGAAVLLAAGIGAVVLLGGDGRPERADAEPGVSPVAAYVQASTGPRNRLQSSARVLGRTLERTSAAGDLPRVVRTARQQLAAVNRARADLGRLRPQGQRARRAHGLLLRASGTHRRVLVSLTRIDPADPSTAIRRFPTTVRTARATLTGYRRAASAIGLPAASVAQEGIADLSGVQQALRARQRQLEAEAAERARERRSDTTRRGGGGLQITGVGAGDLGSVVRVTGSYCDRTPGIVNSFVYTATVSDGAGYTASERVYADQTRACNTIAVDVPDVLPIGSYTATFTVDNLTNNVSASSSTRVTVVD